MRGKGESVAATANSSGAESGNTSINVRDADDSEAAEDSATGSLRNPSQPQSSYEHPAAALVSGSVDRSQAQGMATSDVDNVLTALSAASAKRHRPDFSPISPNSPSSSTGPTALVGASGSSASVSHSGSNGVDHPAAAAACPSDEELCERWQLTYFPTKRRPAQFAPRYSSPLRSVLLPKHAQPHPPSSLSYPPTSHTHRTNGNGASILGDIPYASDGASAAHHSAYDPKDTRPSSQASAHTSTHTSAHTSAHTSTHSSALKSNGGSNIGYSASSHYHSNGTTLPPHRSSVSSSKDAHGIHSSHLLYSAVHHLQPPPPPPPLSAQQQMKQKQQQQQQAQHAFS